MSIKIKKQTGEIFDLPQDFVIEGKKNNPLFSEKGSQTVSISFPATPRNRSLLDDAFRLDRAEKPSQAIPVVIESGPAQQTGRMAINSASPKIIAANIGFDEGEMYSRMSTMKLADMPILSQPQYNITPPGETREQRTDALLAHLTDVMKELTDADYFVFPLILKKDLKENKQTLSGDYRIILNDLDFVWDHLPYGEIAELKGLKHQLLTWYIDSEEVYIDAPKGYGVSPFLKVGRLLEIIFANYGYTVEENPFVLHRQLKKLTVLNNTMDTILSGTLHYRDLMPDISVNEFLDGLYNKFGLLWFVESNTGTVRLRFLKDVLNGSAVDIDRFKTEEPEITYSQQRQLKLTANRDSDATTLFGETVKTLYDTFEEFLAAYNNQMTDIFVDVPLATGTSCIFSAEFSMYRIRENIVVEGKKAQTLSSSDFFDWNKKTPGLEYEEIKMDDLCLPLDYFNNVLMLNYGVGVKHRYSDVVVSGATQKDEENPAKLAFAFGWGLTHYTASNRYNWFFASQINRDPDGYFMNDSEGNKYDISLTVNREDGLYNRFWKEYDAFLRHSAQEVKCTVRMSDAEFLNLKPDQVMMLNYQPVLTEQVKFKLNAPKHSGECTFRTLRLYEPYDLATEQKIPLYERQKYYWKVISIDKTPVITYPCHEESNFGFGFTTIDGVNKYTDMMFILPPTDEQYLHNEQIILTYCKFNS